MTLRSPLVSRWPPRSVFRVPDLATEPLLKFLGMLALGKAEDVPEFVIAVEGVASIAEAQIATEEPVREVVVADAQPARQRDLVRPVAIDAVFR